MATILRRRGSAANVSTEVNNTARPILRRNVRTAANAKAEADIQIELAKKEIEADLKLISQNNQLIDEAQLATEQAHARIEALMKKYKLNGVTDGHLIAELVEQFTRESRVIDPQRFFNAVTRQDDFWECVEVAIGKAKKVLSEKELDKITKTTPSKSTGIVLKIKEYTTATTRKKK